MTDCTTLPIIKASGDFRIGVTAFNTSVPVVGIFVSKGNLIDGTETRFYLPREAAAALGAALIEASKVYPEPPR